MDVLSLKIYSWNITERVIIFNCSASQDWYEGGPCPFVSQYKQKSVLRYLNIRIEVHFFVIGDGDWEIKCNGPVVNLTGALLASQDLYVTRCILIIDLCLEIWEGSGNAYIMPKTDFHCPLILLISDNAMIFRLYIHISLNVGWLIFRQYRELEAGDNQSLKS